MSAAFLVPTTIEQSWSIQDICDAWHLSPDRIRKMMRTGQIGYIQAGHSRRLLAEHIGQLRAALEVPPRTPEPDLPARIGQTPRSAAHRRRTSA